MFKDKLIEIRKENGDTQELLGKKIHVSRSLVAKWEQGRAYPGYDEIELISETYNKPIEFLLSKYELKEVYGFYKKNNKIKTGIIIGISSLLVLAITAIVAFSIGNMNLQTKGRKTYLFNSVKETSYGYEFTEVDTGEKIQISSKDSIKFNYFGNELDEKINISKMNNGYLNYDYHTDFNGLVHKEYTVHFQNPVLEDEDLVKCIYVNLKGHEYWDEFDEEYCIYPMKIEEVHWTDGRVSNVIGTNADEWQSIHKADSYTVTNSTRTTTNKYKRETIDGEYCFYLDTNIFKEYHRKRGEFVCLYESYVFADGRVDNRHYNPIFDKSFDLDDLLWGEKHVVFRFFAIAEGFSYITYPGGTYENNSVVIDSGDKTACHFDYHYKIKHKRNPDKYEIVECDVNDSLIAKTDIKNFEEFDNLTFNENTDHVYCNEYVNGEVTETKREDISVSISFANEVGRFVTKYKSIRAEN